MSKLSKLAAKLHDEAAALLAKDVLTPDDKAFIQAHWQESANHVNSTAGAFFTPPGLARDLAIEVSNSRRVIDLCAGIGTLALTIWEQQAWERHSGSAPIEIVCVELNPEYAAIGKKMLPEARWITGSIFDLPADVGMFDTAISNPPFGAIKRGSEDGTTFRGGEFEYHVIDVAASVAKYGAFIIPQMSAPFSYSGRDRFEESITTKYARFHKQTGITLGPGCGVDTSIYLDEWHGVSPICEIVVADFTELHHQSAHIDQDALFDAEAAA